SIVFVNNIPAFYRLTSEALTSHLEASIRHDRLTGYMLGAAIETGVSAPIQGGLSRLMIYYYRLPDPAGARHAPTTTRHARAHRSPGGKQRWGFRRCPPP